MPWLHKYGPGAVMVYCWMSCTLRHLQLTGIPLHKLCAWSSALRLSIECVVLVVCVQISAKKGTGVDDLLETVALVAELEDLMSNPDRPAAGTVLEAYLDKRIGPISTLLVQTGTLRVGDIVVTGSAYGKVCRPAYKPLALNSIEHMAWHPFCADIISACR